MNKKIKHFHDDDFGDEEGIENDDDVEYLLFFYKDPNGVMIPMSKNKKCILCGNALQNGVSDTFVCLDCEKENVEARYMNNWSE